MKHIPVVMSGEGMVVGIVRSRFNESVGLAMLEACSARLIELGVDTDDIVVASVPGALEVPLALQQMAATDEFDALIALGAVIRGETYHFELVSNESGAGISGVALSLDIPVANGILTTENDQQAAVRAPVKGRECAEAALEMANLAQAIDELAR